MDTLKCLAEMLRRQMMDLVKDSKAEVVKCTGKKVTRTNGLNHCDRDIKFGTNVAFLTLNTTNANTWNKSPKFITPLIGKELLMNNNEETLPDFKRRRNTGKGFAVATRQANDSVVPHAPKRFECRYLVDAQLTAEFERSRQQITT
jgi:hypothetical protein